MISVYVHVHVYVVHARQAHAHHSTDVTAPQCPSCSAASDEVATGWITVLALRAPPPPATSEWGSEWGSEGVGEGGVSRR